MAKKPVKHKPGTQVYWKQTRRLVDSLAGCYWRSRTYPTFDDALSQEPYDAVQIDMALQGAVEETASDITRDKEQLEFHVLHLERLKAFIAQRAGQTGDTECQQCGAFFERRRKTARYCSARCRKRAQRQRSARKVAT